MTICSISTSWRASKIGDGRELISTMKEAGLNTIELEFRITADAFEEIKKNRRKWGIEISSLHAVCPTPGTEGKSAEAFYLNDEDEERRKRGVKDIIKTIRNAADVGASSVIIHCGGLAMEEPIYRMMKFYDAGTINGPEAREILHRALLDRMSCVKNSFQALLKSLDEINSEAEKRGINIGVENRFYFRELPNLEEFGVIFNTFEGGRLFYWHDIGHAHVQEVLFGVSQKMLLETFAHRLIGIHFHDVRGYTDHNEPGSGEIDFGIIKNYIKPNTIRVMELNQRVSLQQAKKGVGFLKEKGIFVD